MKVYTLTTLVMALSLVAFGQTALSSHAIESADELPTILRGHLDNGGSYKYADRITAALKRVFLVGSDNREEVAKKWVLIETRCRESGLRVRKFEKPDFELIYVDKTGEPTDVVSVLSFSYQGSKLDSVGVTYIRR